jgi:hypothetical protein
VTDRQRQANPINRIRDAGKPRGIANEWVYRQLARIESGETDAFERLALRERFARPDKEGPRPIEELRSGLSASDHPVPRLFHADRAFLLERAAAFLEYVAATNSAQTVAKAAQAASVTDAADITRHFDSERDQEFNEVLLAHTHIASASERAALADLRHLHGVAWRTAGTMYAEGFAAAEAALPQSHDGRRPLDVPPSLVRRARAVIRRRRRRERQEADAAHKQLDTLLGRTQADKEQKIGDWMRYARRHGYVPPRTPR